MEVIMKISSAENDLFVKKENGENISIFEKRVPVSIPERGGLLLPQE